MSKQLLHAQPARLMVDFLLVILFVLIGLKSHQQALTDLPQTALPFILALLAGHLGVWAVGSRRQLPLPLEGLMLWVTTLVMGLGLRLSFGETAALAFALVTAGVLLIFLVGWRGILWAIRRRSA